MVGGFNCKDTMASKKRLGDVLRERGKISAEELTRAISEQQGKLLKLGELLLTRGSLEKADLISALEEVTRVPYHNLQEFPPSVEALEYIPRETALRYSAVPYDYDDRALTVVMAEPQNLRTLDELRFLTGKMISPRLGFREEILAAIEKHYASAAEEEAEAAALVESKDPSDDFGKDDVGDIEFISVSSRESAREAMAEFQAELTHRRTPAVRVVSRIIVRAAARRASDIHIEPMAAATTVRIRVDGVLRELMQVKGKLQSSLVSRIKVLSDMDIAERRAPQDGRFMVNLAGRKIDFRISTLPTNHGEKVVMRLLEASAPLTAFAEMGMDEDVVAALKKVLAQPQGMLLVTGPTGSGKSTTLYASLNHLRRPAVNIITVEDPVEYMLDGVNQVQVHPKAGLTFSSALRSILRQDPNIIMVGEIRDAETAEIALKASQTGHLVLSSLHTNDSVSAIVRLVDLGIPEYLIASSLSGIVAQRLVRRLCRCKAAVPVSPELRARLVAHGMDDAGAHAFAPVGCAECGRTGYRGRIGVYEVLLLDEPIRRAVRAKAPVETIRQLARSAGIKWMQEAALEKVRAGLTALEEVQRVIAFDDHRRDHCGNCGKEIAATYLFCPYCATRRIAVAPPGESHTRFAPAGREPGGASHSANHALLTPPGVAPEVAQALGISANRALAAPGKSRPETEAPRNNKATPTEGSSVESQFADVSAEVQDDEIEVVPESGADPAESMVREFRRPSVPRRGKR
jgi:type IV pilus assembly protein PilB